MTFSLFVFAIDRELFAGKAQSLSVPGATGQLQILADHTPLVAVLREGNVVIEGEDSVTHTFPIRDGVVEVKTAEVVVLVNF